MKTLAEDWDEYKNLVLIPYYTEEQCAEIRIAFYAGVYTMIKKVVELELENEKESARIFRQTLIECIEFLKTLKE